MRTSILPALLLCSGLAQAALTKQIASYDIKAALNTTTHTVTATVVITWLNDSKDTVPALQFHLYMNAFRNSRSTFFRESGGHLRGDKFKGEEWGWVDVSSMRVGSADLTKAIRFIHPDDANGEDLTVIEVALPQPVKPGETIQVAVDFQTKFPQIFARTGFHKDFYLGGQWFPKLGVWETAGFRYSTKGAWNCHQFHADSEFFANFGRYHVELTVPANMVVGATGEMTKRVENANSKTSTYTFDQEDVTDFAWTAQPTYLREERMFIADKETTPADLAAVSRIHGIPVEEARLSDVKMIALIQPEHREQMERHFHALRTAIKWFGLWYGRYPYKTITVVDPPYNGEGAGGMEYPTFITAGTSWRMPTEFHELEEVVVHEFGHQFWMELVATNEFEESWLDEGFNTYSTGKIMDMVYGGMGQVPFRVLGINLSRWFQLPATTDTTVNRMGHLGQPVLDNLVRNAWQYYNDTSYGISSYMRTAVTLNTMENILGADTMARVMRTYHQRWRFGHPDSRDYQKVVNEVSGRNMDWFFDQFVFGNRVLNYGVGDVSSNEIKTQLGAFERDGKRVVITSKDGKKQDAENEKDKKFKAQYECTVKIRRFGDAVAPVDVVIHFKDGTVEKRAWDGEYRWVQYTFLKPSEIEWVQVDPERKYQLDVSYSNNSWQEEYQAQLSAHWGGNLLFWLQNLLLWMSAVA